MYSSTALQTVIAATPTLRHVPTRVCDDILSDLPQTCADPPLVSIAPRLSPDMPAQGYHGVGHNEPT